MRNIILACCVLLSLNLWAQREKKMEHLLNLDTTQVVISSKKVPYIEKVIARYGSDTIIRKRFFVEDEAKDSYYDYYGYYSNYYPFQYNSISFDKKKNKYILLPAYEGFIPKKAHFAFKSNLSAGWVNRLPERQSEFGQNTVPDEQFSWGAPIDKSYNPYDFFQTSLGATNVLDYYTLLSKTALLNVHYSNTMNRGIVPEATSMTNDFMVKISNMRLKKWMPYTKLGLQAKYLITQNELTENGNNYSRLFYDIATTPPNFDNTQGNNSGGKAFTNPDGSEHRYTNSVDNPYRYIDNSLDEETHQNASAAFSLKNKSWDWKIGYDYNQQKIQSGIMPYAMGMTENVNGRDEKLGVFNSKLQYKVKFEPDFYSWRWDWAESLLRSELLINYNLNSTTYDAQYTQAGNVSSDRITNDLSLQYSNRSSSRNQFFFYNLWVNANTSNTLNDKKVFFSEGLGVALRIDRHFLRDRLDLYWDFPYGLYIKPRYTLSRVHNESPLYYTQPHYGSTRISTEDFRNYQEQYPLFQNSNLIPEATTRNEVGLDIGDYRSRWGSFEVNYFWNRTTDGILPVYQNNRFELTNVIDWNKEGYEITYNISGGRYRRISWSANANFTSYKTMVKNLLTDNDHIALAGFSDVSVSVLKGEQYGVIYGQKTDGTMGVIGDPTPDYTLNFNLTLNWRNWGFICTMGYAHGGDCWNGTQNTMNYLGVSKQSAANRTAQTPADSPYYAEGTTGIAQNAIEDASTLRLHNISLSYDFSKRVEIPELKLSLGLNNLILWSAYSGVDPARPLFGYAAAQGLDYFNMPSTTNVTLALTMKF